MNYMKRKNIIIVLWILWIVSMIGMVFGVYYYINNKRIRLRSEIRENVVSIFEGQSNGDMFVSNNDGFFDVAYSDSPVRHYKKVAIPSKPSKGGLAAINPSIYEEIVDDWNQSYGDLASLYELNWGDKYPNQEDDGWSIIRIHCGGSDEDFIQTNTIFPYKVGLKKSEWGNFYTVEQAVNEAFEFYATSPKSGYSERFSRGSNNRLWSKIHDSSNEYFWIVENENPNRWKAGTPIYHPKGKSYDEVQRTMPYENGWMHNGYYRVFIAATQEKHYMIEEKDWAVNENRNHLLLWWGISLTVLFMSLVIPLTIKESKVNKKKSETLHQRLVRLCNPKNFIDNYDKEKVEKANIIYKRLLETTPDNNDDLIEIQMQASSELGINFIDNAELEDLKEKVNPKRFLNPYNAEKVSLANELYAVLAKDNLTYGELVEVKEKLKLL